MHHRLFYGWYLVIASLTSAAFFSAIFTYGWTAFIDPIRLSLGWSMTTISLASTMKGVESGIFNPIWGRAVDRLPAARLMIIGILCTGVGILVVSFSKNRLVDPIIPYYVGFFVMGLGSSLSTSMVPSAVMSRWFRKDIGKANGIFYMGVGIGGVMVPLVVKLVDRFGWQPTLMVSAIAYMAIGIPLALILKDKPEDLGLVPDGRIEDATRPGRPARGINQVHVPVREALKTRAFWHICVVFFFQSAVLGVITQFAIPHLTNMGISRSAAGFVFLLFTVISLAGRFSMGILTDIFPKKHVQAVTIASLGLGLFIFWVIDAQSPYWITVLFALTYGIGIAGIMPLRIPLLAEYFGTRNIGAIFGITGIASTIAGVAAAPLAGHIFDVYHDYRPAIIFLAGFSLLALVLMLTIPAPARSAAEK
jgi:OFA family oxalate/formate antiporter-like MFS transporter